MRANLLRVNSVNNVIVHIPGAGSVVSLNLRLPFIEMAKGVCVTPENPVPCTISPGEYIDGAFNDSSITVEWPHRKRARPAYKAPSKI